MSAVSKSALEQRHAAAQRLLELTLARDNYLDFVRLIHPTWKFPAYQVSLMRILDRFGKFQLRRTDIDTLIDNPSIDEAALNWHDPVIHNLLVNMPVRHAKSANCTEMWPTWMMLRDARRYLMTCSYNSELAGDFGRAVRNLTQDPQVKLAFDDFALAKDSQASDVWRTNAGGAYFGIGMGATTSGRPANILTIDDPVKNRAEAESLTSRNKVWSYYTSALRTRLQPDADGNPPLQLVVLTRWHPDDLGGRLMDTEEWKEGLWGHVNMPALRFLKQPDGTTKKIALWPERFPVESLERTERINAREFASLYQQLPYIEGGNIVKSSWWRRYPQETRPERFACIIIGVDTAYKAKEENDYTAIVVAGLDMGGDIYILDVVRGKWEYPDLKRRLLIVNAAWRGKGLRATYIEDKASGQALVQELRRDQAGFSVIPYKVPHDKVLKVNLVAPLIEGGRVFIPESAPWLDDWVHEWTTFPGVHDDQVDAGVIVLDALSRISVTPDADVWAYEPLESITANVNRSLSARMASSIKSRIDQWRGWGE